MISRCLTSHLNELLRHSPAVVLLGPCQAGKTTLALEIGEQTASIYLDLEDEILASTGKIDRSLDDQLRLRYDAHK
jgi:predicted AAA+ superfamily ATPase